MTDGLATPYPSPSLTPMQQLVACLAEQQHETSSDDGHGADSVLGSPSSGTQNLPLSNTNLPINSDSDNQGLTSNLSSPTNRTSNLLTRNKATTITATISLVYLAPALKHACKSGPQASTELDIFLVVCLCVRICLLLLTNWHLLHSCWVWRQLLSLEREGYQYALTLTCHDKLMSLVGHLNYKVLPTLNVHNTFHGLFVLLY